MPVVAVDVVVAPPLGPGERTRGDDRRGAEDEEVDTPSPVMTPAGVAPAADGDADMRSAKPPCDGRDGRLARRAFMGEDQ